MRIHERLVLGTFLRYLLYTLVGSFILFTLVDLFDHLGSLLDNQATGSMIVRYYLYKGAWIIDQVLPVAVLMAQIPNALLCAIGAYLIWRVDRI